MTNSEADFQMLEGSSSLPFQGHDEEWQELMRVLRLPLDHWEAVKLVLDQGRWRTANDSVGYVRIAARREYRKLDGGKCSKPFSISDLRVPRDQVGERIGHDETIEFLAAQAPRDDGETPYVNLRVCDELLIAESSDDDARHSINFAKLMNLVRAETGLAESQTAAITEVLCLRYYLDYSREKILNHPDPAGRKRRQTAYRWISQNRALLKRILSGRPRVAARNVN
jgi:hypothetical protein